MKKAIKVLIIALVVCLIFSINMVTASAMTLEEARSSVFRVMTIDNTGALTSLLSCFAVGEDNGNGIEYFIGSGDAILWAGPGGKIQLLRSQDDMIDLTVYQELPACNLVIFRSRDKLYNVKPLPLASKDMANLSGKDYYSLGFPYSAIQQGISAYSEDVTVTQGILSKQTEVGGLEVYQTSIDIEEGCFGGPLIDNEGNVYAVNAFNSGTSGINGAVLIDYVTDVLDSRGIKYEKAGEVIVEETPAPETVIEAAPTPVPVTPEAAPQPTATPVEQTPDNTMLYIIIAAIAVLLIVIIIVVVMITKKNKTPQLEYQQQMDMGSVAPTMAMGETEAKVSSAKLKCLTGKLMGKTVELSEGVPVSMGRDPKLCQIVFNTDSGAISRKHCTIRYNGANGTFTLEDSSTNGTFLVSGKRLEKGKGYTLNAGDRFYLDTKLNTFEVSID